MSARAWIAPLLLVAVGCGPTRSATRIVEASAELAAADTVQANKQSPYEYRAAKQYLSKAREEQSYAEFEAAENLARKARDCARLARARSEASTRSELGARRTRLPKGVHCRPGPPMDEEQLERHASDVADSVAPPAPDPVKKGKSKAGKTPKKRRTTPAKEAKKRPVEPQDEEPADPPEGDDPLPEGEP